MRTHLVSGHNIGHCNSIYLNIVSDIVYNIMHGIIQDIVHDISNCLTASSNVSYAGLHLPDHPPSIQDQNYDPIQEFEITGGGDVCHARLLPFFNCTLCPRGRMGDTWTYKDRSLVFFSTFVPISLTPDICMRRKGAPVLQE
jgi:hypothetical protein